VSVCEDATHGLTVTAYAAIKCVYAEKQKAAVTRDRIVWMTAKHFLKS